MSASFQDDDRDWVRSIFKQGKWSTHEYDVMQVAFEQQTDYDVKAIEKNIRQHKYLKRLCLYKICISPIEYFATMLFFGFKKAKLQRKTTLLYLKYYKGKITMAGFKKTLDELLSPNLKES